MSRFKRRFWVGVLVGVMALLIWDFAGRRHAKSVLLAHKAAILARGEKLAVGDLAPSLPPAALAAGSELYALAVSLQPGTVATKTPPAAMRFVLPGKARVGWREPFLRGDQATNAWEDLAAELERNQPVLDRIQRTLREPQIAQRLDYAQGFNVLLPHITKFKSVAQQLSWATALALHEGRLDAAASRLDALLALPEALRDEPLLISQLVRIAITGIAFNATWEALQADGWTDTQLAALQARWDSFEFLIPLSRSMSMERAMGLDFVDKLRKSDTAYDQVLAGASGGGSSWPSAPASPGDVPNFVGGVVEQSLATTEQKIPILLWRWRWSYHDEDALLRVYDSLLEFTGAMESGRTFVEARDALRRKEAALEAEFSGSPRRFMVSAVLPPSVSRAFDRVGRMEVQREMALAAIALKRYELREHHAASALADLVPGILARVPRDFIDGQPLRYDVNPDGSWLLYSVGENGVDDGGNPEPMKPMEASKIFTWGRDVVWPEPATSEEIARQDEEEKARPPTRMSVEMMKRYGLLPAK